MATTTVINKRCQFGFTLIEVMLVMAILGLIASAVVFTLPGGERGKDSPHNAAVTLRQQLNYAREYAMVRQQPTGIKFHEDGYEFLFWQDEQWLTQSPRGLRAQKTEFPLRWQFSSQGLQVLEQNESLSDGLFSEESDENKQVPDILILPSGEMTLFSIHIEHLNDPQAERWLIAENSWLISISAEAPE
ncbi:type II secretion system minor pseudopilin GspH [Idiomarina aminovorans]|uniref:type II secretion system minor pseudopilin GspH n=1 Tax=Idiomarina aminovorans TaxID=2914829 RepID=UPI002002B04F|nr:type II secretion system minor pseudopilin GspH [Idiomarina sp. ATCH4]MCK7459390.1 type II secretion system minor pseudopilin GspH [Idiomarina sp. ATCH4]